VAGKLHNQEKLLRYFGKSREEIERSGTSTQPRNIPGSPYWVMTNSPTHQKKQMLRDALKLLAVFVQHTDNKPAQQRLVCVDDKSEGDEGVCAHTVMMVNDLGQTFGRSNLFNRDRLGSVNLERWSGSHVWSSKSNRDACFGDLPTSQSGSLDNPRIGEAGRRFLSDLLMQLSDAQLRDLFSVSRFPDRVEPGVRPTTVDDWVAAFKKKRGEIASRVCPS
jgi:hypothetical protein